MRAFCALLLLVVAACEAPTAPKLPVAGVAVSALSTALEVNQTLQLTASVLSNSGTVLSDRAVTWQSSNSAVATVSPAGVVRGLSGGSVQITASVEGKSGSINLFVNFPPCTSTLGVTGGALTLGAPRQGNLATAQCVFFGYLNAVGHPFTLNAVTSLQFDLVATGTAPNLIVTTATGESIAGGSAWSPSTASVRATLGAGGYIVWAATDETVTTATPYTLTATVAAGACGGPAGAASLGDALSPVISLSSCVLLDGPVAEGYTLTLDEPTRLSLLVSANAFPPMVALFNAGGSLIDYTVGPAGNQLELQVSVPAGVYGLWAGTFSGGTGAMSLLVTSLPPCAAPTPLALGVTVGGTLEDSDCGYLGQGGAKFDQYRITLDATTTLRIDLTSTDFDALMAVTTAGGEFIAADDDSGEGLNSRLTITLPAGTYDIWAGAYSEFGRGAYQLSTMVTSADVVTAQRAPLKSPDALWPPSRTDGTRRTEWPPKPLFRR